MLAKLHRSACYPVHDCKSEPKVICLSGLHSRALFGAPHGQCRGLCPAEGATERLMCRSIIPLGKTAF